MRIRVGYDLTYNCPQETPMILMLNVHYSRASDIVIPDYLTTDPAVPVDGLSRWFRELVQPDRGARGQNSNPRLGCGDGSRAPGSGGSFRRRSTRFRICPKKRWSSCWEAAIAKRIGSPTLPGVSSARRRRDGRACRRSAIGYTITLHSTTNTARPTRTAWEAYNERIGVCRDYAHLAIAFCRCMNIPARYCTGYLGDIGMPPPYAVGDFAAWMEVYLGGHWYIFDPRNNMPRIGQSADRAWPRRRRCRHRNHLRTAFSKASRSYGRSR